MDAFDMLSEPVLFAQHLCEHADRVHQSVEAIPLLTEALLAEDYEKLKTLHEQISSSREEAEQIKLSLYEQIQNMHFHRAGGHAFGEYLACQDKVASSAQEIADLLVLRRTTIPSELHADFRAFVTQVVDVSRRMVSLREGLCSETQTIGAEAETRSPRDALQGVHDGNGQARRLELKFTKHVYGLEKQLDPVAILFLDKCCAALHELAGNGEHAADHLCLMIRQG